MSSSLNLQNLMAEPVPLSVCEAQRIFHKDVISVKSISLSRCPPELSEAEFRSLQELEASLSLNSEEPKPISILFLRQEYTWSRIQLTKEAFAVLASRIRNQSDFFSLIRGFGLKFEPLDENHVDYYLNTLNANTSNGRKPIYIEQCYNIRYFDRHNRSGTKALWSERQVAVYHRFDARITQSYWVILQLPRSVQTKLLGYVESLRGTDVTPEHHFWPHILIIIGLNTNWRAYLAFLEAQIAEIDEKALHSRVGRVRESDYTVAFADAQELERLRKKLVKASLLLKLNASVGREWASQMRDISKKIGIEDFELLELISQFSFSHSQHLLVAESLSARLTGTLELVLHILSFRNTELEISTNNAIRGNGERLQLLTRQIVDENGSMRQITAEMQGDSKFIKVLTLVAVLYTPASLVATVLSSNLVHTLSRTEEDQHLHMALVSDFWKYPLWSAVLICITLLATFIWWKYWLKLRQRAGMFMRILH